jgi:hypothetical protein
MVTERLGFGQTGYPSRAATSPALNSTAGPPKTRSVGEGADKSLGLDIHPQ